MDTGKCIFLFYSSDVLPMFHFKEYVKPLVEYAHNEKGYKCACFDLLKFEFHKDKFLQETLIGVLFFYDWEIREVNNTFDMAKFTETLDKVPSLEELTLARAKAKAKAEAEAEAKPTKVSRKVLVDRLDTSLKCKEFVVGNKHSVIFFYNPERYERDRLLKVISPLVKNAIRKQYNCACYSTADIEFHKEVKPAGTESGNGVLFFYDNVYVDYMDGFSDDEFTGRLKDIPQLAKTKAEAAAAAEKEAADRDGEVVEEEPKPHHRRKDYDVNGLCCVIL
ncbi:hypothetical protein EV174_004730 [Coemansia sp. RSA 2320]|nr:hypothetical protein EV174_004730 [Coemansia sp. RSA 2320]